MPCDISTSWSARSAVSTAFGKLASPTTLFGPCDDSPVTPWFDCARGEPAYLELATAPAGAVGGIALTTQPVVRILDADGNLCTDSTLSVTVTVDISTLTGGTVAAVGGIATFMALTLADVPLVRASLRTLTFAAVGVTSINANLTVALGNDMLAWYKDDANNTLDASSPPHLLSVYDRTGHGNTLNTAAGTILRQASLQNAKPGFDFAQAGYLDNLTIGVQGGFTWFGVFKIVATATYQNLFDAIAAPSTWLFWDQPNNKWQVGDRLAGLTVAGAYVTLVVHYANSGANVRVIVRGNGVELLNTTLLVPGGLIPGAVGAGVNKTFPQFRRPITSFVFTSLMMEWGFYGANKAGTATETALEAYLRAAYATW